MVYCFTIENMHFMRALDPALRSPVLQISAHNYIYTYIHAYAHNESITAFSYKRSKRLPDLS